MLYPTVIVSVCFWGVPLDKVKTKRNALFLRRGSSGPSVFASGMQALSFRPNAGIQMHLPYPEE